jgi:hypothetical protein
MFHTSLALALTLAATPTPMPAVAAAVGQPAIPACPSTQDKPDPALLIRRFETLLQGTSTTGTMRMTIQTKAWTRTLKLQTWAKGEDYALIRVVEGGPRETGMMTLKREGQLWNWLPRAARTMKLPSGMLGDAWMGSDFTNDDLVRGQSMADAYTATVVGVVDHAVAGANKRAWHIRLVPTKDAVVVWGKVELFIETASCLPLEQRFYDEEGALARTMTFGDFRQVGWRNFPSTTTVTPGDGERSTTIHYDDIAFDTDIPDDVFSLHRLQQGR